MVPGEIGKVGLPSPAVRSLHAHQSILWQPLARHALNKALLVKPHLRGDLQNISHCMSEVQIHQGSSCYLCNAHIQHPFPHSLVYQHILSICAACRTDRACQLLLKMIKNKKQDHVMLPDSNMHGVCRNHEGYLCMAFHESGRNISSSTSRPASKPLSGRPCWLRFLRFRSYDSADRSEAGKLAEALKEDKAIAVEREATRTSFALSTATALALSNSLKTLSTRRLCLDLSLAKLRPALKLRKGSASGTGLVWPSMLHT